MACILILGSMHDFATLTKFCKEKGYYTIVCDAYVNGPAKKIADKSFDIDIFDTEGIANAVKDYNVKGIVTGFSDLVMEAYVPLCKRLHVPCYMDEDMLECIRNKMVMKEVLKKQEVRTAQYIEIDEENIANQAERLNYPIVIKPADGYGSRGVYIIDSPKTLHERFSDSKKCSKIQKVIAEDYCNGDEYNVMAWVMHGKGFILYIARRQKYAFSTTEIPLVHRFIYPAKEIDELKDKMTECVNRIIQAYGIKEGPVVAQFFYDGENVIIGEATTRLFGSGDHRAIYYGNQLKVEELLVGFAMSDDSYEKYLETLDNYNLKFDKRVVQVQLYAREGRVKSLQGVADIHKRKDVYQFELYYDEGDTISTRGTAFATVGMLFFEVENDDQIAKKTKEIMEKLEIINENGENLLVFMEEEMIN